MAILKCANEKGKYHDPDARASAINYILSPLKASHYYGGYGVDLIDIAGSMDEVAMRFGKTTGVQLRHYIISFSSYENITPAKVNRIAIAAASFFKEEYQVIFAVHEDSNIPHIHIIFNAISYVDGHRYGGAKHEFCSFKNYMREVLRCYFNVYSFKYVS